MIEGLRRWPLWTFLAWQDIKRRYRGSRLGPFWTVANVAATALGIGVLYSTILRQDMHEYVPFLTAGIIVWFFISNTLTDSTQAFLQADTMIRHAALPLFVFPVRVVMRNLIVLAHNVIVYLVVILVFGVVPNLLWLAPGLILLVANVGWGSLLVALVGTRYRDVAQIISNFLTFFLFLSPIFWPPDLADNRAHMVLFNPVTHLLEVIRAPALGHAPDPTSLAVTAGMAVMGWAVALLFFARYRFRVVHWL